VRVLDGSSVRCTNAIITSMNGQNHRYGNRKKIVALALAKKK